MMERRPGLLLATVWILLRTLERIVLRWRRIGLLKLVLLSGVSSMSSSKVHTVAPNSIVVRQRAFDVGIPPEQ